MAFSSSKVAPIGKEAIFINNKSLVGYCEFKD